MKCWGVEEPKQSERPLSRGSVNLSHIVETVDSQGRKVTGPGKPKRGSRCEGDLLPQIWQWGLMATQLPYRRFCLRCAAHRACQA